MKTFILINQGLLAVKLLNWKQICNPIKYDVILITDAAGCSIISESDKKLITAIHKTQEFSFASLRSIIEKEILPKYKNILMLTNQEFILLPCAKLREYFQIPGDREKDILFFRNKVLMKQKLANLNCLPKYVKFDSEKFNQDKDKYIKQIINYLGLPLFVKPTEEAGSLGAQKIFTRENFISWAKKNIDQREFKIDEFIEGELYHCDSIIKNKTILYAGMGNCTPNHQFFSAKPVGSIFLEQNDPNISLIKDFNNKIIASFDYIPNGITHLELFKTAQGKLIFLQIAVRPPGGLIGQMYQKHIGLNYMTLHYILQMGLDFKLEVKKGPYAAFVWFPYKKGTVIAINEPKHLKSNYTFTAKVKIGQVLDNPQNILNIAAEILLWNNNYSQLLSDFLLLKKYESVSVKN